MYISIALVTAGLLGLIYIALSLRVSLARRDTKVATGDGGGKPEAESLLIAMRAHANFGEYVPLALILLTGIEAAGAGRWLCIILAIMLVAARIMHPIGMAKPVPNPYRAGGAVLTWLMLLWASLEALYLAL